MWILVQDTNNAVEYRSGFYGLWERSAKWTDGEQDGQAAVDGAYRYDSAALPHSQYATTEGLDFHGQWGAQIPEPSSLHLLILVVAAILARIAMARKKA